MSRQHNHAITRHYTQPQPSPVSRHAETTLTEWFVSSPIARDLTTELAASAPGVAVRALARGLRRQTRGAKLSTVRQLVEAIGEGEPGFADDVARGLGEA